MYLRRTAVAKSFIAAYVVAALYCEWFVYVLQPMSWAELKCSEDDTCIKILFIADPQIQGDLAVPPPLNYLFSWDSDRYLKSTFSVVTKQFKPDVLVYLGDLMDEGSIATKQQYHQYVKRLLNIFTLDNHVVQVWLPGDNDIGGENEPIKQDKIEEFEKVFKQPSVIVHNSLYIYKVNAITNTFPKVENNSSNVYKIVASHYPVTMRHSFGEQVNNEIHPNIYFCAHSHESKYVKQYKNLSHRETFWMNTRKEILVVPDTEESLYEVYVPTCSYRMGTSKIGYGAAILEKQSKNLRYTVFWSPQRFPYLFFYLVLFIIIIVYGLVFWTAKILQKCRQPISSVWSNDKVPLLR